MSPGQPPARDPWEDKPGVVPVRKGEGGPRFKASKGQRTNNRTSRDPGGRRATDSEVQRRVEECARLIMPGRMTKTEIHAFFAKKYRLSAGVVDSIYIRRAYQHLADHVDIGKREARQLVCSLVDKWLRSGSFKKERAAGEVIMRLCGLESPRRTELTGRDGGPVSLEAKQAALPPERLRELLEVAKSQAEAQAEVAPALPLPAVQGGAGVAA